MAIVGKTYQISSEDVEKIRIFIRDYKIENIGQQIKVIREMPNYQYCDYSDFALDRMIDYNETHMAYHKMEIPERALVDIVNKLDEFDKLMHDPETRDLVQKALFIYRLKNGTEI